MLTRHSARSTVSHPATEEPLGFLERVQARLGRGMQTPEVMTGDLTHGIRSARTDPGLSATRSVRPVPKEAPPLSMYAEQYMLRPCN
jgi:hypothetical protein